MKFSKNFLKALDALPIPFKMLFLRAGCFAILIQHGFPRGSKWENRTNEDLFLGRGA